MAKFFLQINIIPLWFKKCNSFRSIFIISSPIITHSRQLFIITKKTFSFFKLKFT